MIAKYVMTPTGIIIFPGTYMHSDFAWAKPTSAGFITLHSDKENETQAHCYGESVSLQMQSHPSDSAKANKQLKTGTF